MNDSIQCNQIGSWIKVLQTQKKKQCLTGAFIHLKWLYIL